MLDTHSTPVSRTNSAQDHTQVVTIPLSSVEHVLKLLGRAHDRNRDRDMKACMRVLSEWRSAAETGALDA